MTEQKSSSQASSSSASKSAGDFGQKEIQHSFDEASKKGYFGSKVDPLPNSAHSLESGPDAPTIEDQRVAAAKAESEDRS